MRPRRIRRGNAPAPAMGISLSRCFNEAAANSPRKRRSLRLSVCGRHRFNEAAANSPRKPQLVTECRIRVLASMRPRRIRRGNVGDGPRRTRPEDASMRPRRIRRGNGEKSDGSSLPPFASMRPRRIRRGNEPVEFSDTDRSSASMRPRRIRRGNRSTSVATCATGNCFNEAAANSPRKPANWTSRRKRWACFNEAAANSPRKPHIHVWSVEEAAELQ